MQPDKNLPSPWDKERISNWFDAQAQNRVRSYEKDVLNPLRALPANLFTLETYGALSIDPAIDPAIDPSRYPLHRVIVGDLQNGKPNILITGGVHGYEPSGIMAAIDFLQNDALSLTKTFNFVVYPCISPWAYEHNHRWNNQALDPNRQFSRAEDKLPADECTHFMTSIENLGVTFDCAIDLHETPDRDIDLRQQRADRFGLPLAKDFRIIPNGFYLILTQAKQHGEFLSYQYGQKIINAVKAVSPIANDTDILGCPNKDGIIMMPPSEGTMRTYLQQHATQVAVTEVYPDHPAMTSDKSIATQKAAIQGALDFCRLSSP